MSNPWAVIGLTYDGEDIQLADFSIYLWVQNGLNEVPTVRGVDTVVPGKPGRSARNRENDVLPIVLSGSVMSDPTETDQDAARATFRNRMLLIRSLFASNRLPADLVAELENGDTATISARPMNILVPQQIEGVYASLSIELEGLDDWTYVVAS